MASFSRGFDRLLITPYTFNHEQFKDTNYCINYSNKVLYLTLVKIRIMKALLYTSILAFLLASCSKEDDQTIYRSWTNVAGGCEDIEITKGYIIGESYSAPYTLSGDTFYHPSMESFFFIVDDYSAGSITLRFPNGMSCSYN